MWRTLPSQPSIFTPTSGLSFLDVSCPLLVILCISPCRFPSPLRSSRDQGFRTKPSRLDRTVQETRVGCEGRDVVPRSEQEITTVVGEIRTPTRRKVRCFFLLTEEERNYMNFCLRKLKCPKQRFLNSFVYSVNIRVFITFTVVLIDFIPHLILKVRISWVLVLGLRLSKKE